MQRRLRPYGYFVGAALLGLVIAWASADAQSPSSTTSNKNPPPLPTPHQR
jgi:hypothetical protein